MLNPYMAFSVLAILAPGLAALVGLGAPVPDILASGLAAIVGLGLLACILARILAFKRE